MAKGTPGSAFDFGPLAEGDILPQAAVNCFWLVSDVTRRDGHIELTLILPYGSNAPDKTRFPEPLVITQDGPAQRPHYDAEPEIEEVRG